MLTSLSNMWSKILGKTWLKEWENIDWKNTQIILHAIKAGKFIVSNGLYILWFIINFYVARAIVGNQSLVIAIYVISIATALSPMGEAILRIIENCREIATKEEKTYLLPLFEEVFERAKEIDPILNDEIQLYIIDGMHIDSFAVGQTTIAVTRGAISTLTEEELKGLIAHELGHMSYGHTKARLIVKIGNAFFALLVRGSKLLSKITEEIYRLIAKRSFWKAVIIALIYITRYITDALIFLFITSGEILIAYNSRLHDTQADKFAYKMGYGQELISALYLLQKITIHSKITVMERAKAMRPFIAFRIRDLEQLEDDDENTEEEQDE